MGADEFCGLLLWQVGGCWALEESRGPGGGRPSCGLPGSGLSLHWPLGLRETETHRGCVPLLRFLSHWVMAPRGPYGHTVPCSESKVPPGPLATTDRPCMVPPCPQLLPTQQPTRRTQETFRSFQAPLSNTHSLGRAALFHDLNANKIHFSPTEGRKGEP